MTTYYQHGGFSDRVADICDGITITDISNPSQPVDSTYDWIVQGDYSDGQNLDGSASSGASLTWSALDPDGNPVVVYQGGIPKSANKLPFIILAVAPTLPVFIYNVPRVPCVYRVIVIFSKPDGEDTIIDEWEVKVV